jgi:hypothetical protein
MATFFISASRREAGNGEYDNRDDALATRRLRRRLELGKLELSNSVLT